MVFIVRIKLISLKAQLFIKHFSIPFQCTVLWTCQKWGVQVDLWARRVREFHPLLGNMWKQNLVYVIHCGRFIGPTVLGESNVPIIGKLNRRKTSANLSGVIIIWGGRKSPAAVLAKTAVICLLSSIPAISTRLDPSFAIVHQHLIIKWIWVFRRWMFYFRSKDWTNHL